MQYKKTFRISATLLLMTAALVATASAQKLGVKASGTKTVKLSDKVGQNQFNWSSDAPLEKIKGTAEGVTGSFTIDPANPSSIRGTISASVATMKSGNSTRDKHLRSSTWLDADKHPNITFTITSVDKVTVKGNKMNATATGKFSMHGVTKTIAIPFELTYLDESDKTRKRAPGDLVMISADFSISLNDFNVQGSKGTIGSKVGETIEINAQLFGSTGL